MCCAGGWEELGKLQLSVIKPLTLDWIYTAYEWLKARPDIVLNGWDASGLLAPFKEETAATALKHAKLATIDPKHPYYPLFPAKPNTDPEHGEPSPPDTEVSDYTALDDTDDRQIAVDLALADVDEQAAQPAAAPAQKRGAIAMSSGQQLYPMFGQLAKRARSQQAGGA